MVVWRPDTAAWADGRHEWRKACACEGALRTAAMTVQAQELSMENGARARMPTARECWL